MQKSTIAPDQATDRPLNAKQTTPRFTHGCFRSSLLVSDVHDGAKCGGVFRESVFTFLGEVSLDHTCEWPGFALVPLFALAHRVSRSFFRGTCLWLWLGVLDAIQGVGLGMILLQTLSRLHVCATLALAQMVGSIVAIVARATAPDKNGPGGVFPNPSLWDINGSGDNNPLTVSRDCTSQSRVI